ncbi:MAG TPA: hypothetical protein VL003_03545 [Pusillimonas sp.]|uniref:hypothetical protein n=1 Tax=Pusillimonas sp. TaxID=3040095 RepID=UPI002CA398A5|nr:hypothetical protein [Pusillimonas sp.]HUH87108.1 hypothetical protein [Pusillimonas sp.]
MTDEETAGPAPDTATSRVPLVAGIRLLPIMTLAILLFFAVALINVLRSDVPWQLHLTAQTETIEFDLITPTQWKIGFAVICIPEAGGAGTSPRGETSVCGGSNWQPLPVAGTALARGLELRADEHNPIKIRISSGPSPSSRPSGLIRMTLRREGASLGLLREIDRPVVRLPSEMNLLWLAAPSPAQASVIVLPFYGTTKVGHDVSSGFGEMLQGGKLAVFATSDETLTGRSLAEESELALGDQVRLGAAQDNQGNLLFPKGFVRFTTSNPTHEVKVLDVAMFARADAVEIDRYGGGNFSFQASWWVKIKHKSGVVIAVVLATGFLTLLSALFQIIQVVSTIKVKRWFP